MAHPPPSCAHPGPPRKTPTRPHARHPGLSPRVPLCPPCPRPHLSLRPLSCPSSRPPRGRGKTGSSPQRAAAEMRQTGWSGREDGGRKRTGYLERPANSWAYLCAAEAQESLQNSAQLERGPRPAPGPGLRPRPVAPRAVAGCWWQGGDVPGTGKDGDKREGWGWGEPCPLVYNGCPW